MPFPPSQSSDLFDVSQEFVGNNPQPALGFAAAQVPSSTGLGTRTGRIPSNRTAVTTRNLIHWLVPEGPIVQMYCNPQNIRYDYSKNIESKRTKGGFVIQYWGENLTQLSINGTTGTSGIEGINVLHDLYRNEQLALDPFALFLAAKQRQQSFAGDIFDVGSSLFNAETAGDVGNTLVGALAGAAQEAFPQASSQAPTLASLASQVEMYWSGEVFRGYFTGFSVTESVTSLGMFDYEIKFTVTQKRGLRKNFLAWHRSPVLGPSDSNPNFGVPHSFDQRTGLIEGIPSPPRLGEQADVISEFESLANSFKKSFEAPSPFNLGGLIDL